MLFVIIQVHIGTMREKARGQLTLQSADPTMPPALEFNYLDNEDDIRDLRACVHFARKVCGRFICLCAYIVQYALAIICD